MKKLITLSIFLVSMILQAQNLPTAKTFKQQDSIYWKTSLQIIKPQITTGILYDKVYPISNLYNFNTNNYNTSNASIFKQAVSEIYRSSTNKSQFKSIEDLKIIKKQAFQSNNTNTPIVEIGVLNTSFNFLHYNENDENKGGLKRINNILTPITGKTTVFTKHISLVSPQRELVTASSNGTVAYRLNSTLYFNRDKRIKTLTSNLGSNNTYTLISNETINSNIYHVTYSSFGKKIITFNITYTDDTTLTTYATIWIANVPVVTEPLTDCTKTNVISYTSTIPYKAWNEQTAIHGKLEYGDF